MKLKQHTLTPALLLRLATLIALTIAFLFSSCAISKKSNLEKNDSVAVKKLNTDLQNTIQSGASQTTSNQSHQEDEWYRMTVQYPDKKNTGDTMINNFITQPATIIYEKGKTIRDETSKTADTNWYKNKFNLLTSAIDSLDRKTALSEKNKMIKTKLFPWWTVLLFGAALFFVYKRFVPNSIRSRQE